MDDIQVNPSIKQGHSTDIYERSNLTRLQLLYWTGHKLRPGTPIFNTIPTFIISGKVDRAHFERAFAALLQHNDALRTVIREIDGVPQREIVSSFPHPVLEHVDLSAETDPKKALQSWLQKRCVVPLDLGVCLFDSALVKTASERYVWYLNQDHMITDASSAFLLFELLVRFYELSLRGEPLEISGLPTFENYAEYERKYRNSPQAARAQAYWKEKLSPGPEAITYYGEVPAKRGTQVQRVTYDLGVERSQRVRAVAKREDIFMISEDLSLYNIFAALFFIQLHQASGNHRLGFVTPVHNRFTQVFRNTVGLLLELSPFQVEISEGETFISLVKKVKRETRETMTYYQYGSGLSLPKESFDIMFNMYQTPVLELDGMPVQFERVHPGHGSESLALHVNDLGASRSILLYFDFHQDVFTEERRAQMVQDYIQLLDAFLENDSCSINDGVTQSNQQSGRLSPAKKSSELKKNGRSSSSAPQDLLELQLRGIWEELLEVKPIGVNDNFFELGGNSWLAVRLFVQVEELTGQYLPLTTLLDMGTISDLAKAIRRNMGDSLWSTLVTIQPGSDRTPLYMVPGAGGNGLAVSRIAQHLGQDQPVRMFQIPLGGEEDDAPFSSIEEMAAHYVEALRSAQPEGPYLLGGYSAGGLVAFEVAQQLLQQGQKVDLLAIIDVAAQSSNFKYVRQLTRRFSSLFGIRSEEELRAFLFLRDALFRLNYFLRLGYRDSVRRYTSRVRNQLARPKRFLQLERQEKKNRVLGKLGKVNARNPEKSPNRADHSKAVEDGDLAWQSEDRYMQRYFEINNIAVKSYIPKTYSGRIVLFRSVEGYQYAEQRSPDPYLGWRKIAAGGVEMHEIAGNHMQIVREPNVKILGEKLKECLDRVQSNGRPVS